MCRPYDAPLYAQIEILSDVLFLFLFLSPGPKQNRSLLGMMNQCLHTDTSKARCKRTKKECILLHHAQAQFSLRVGKRKKRDGTLFGKPGNKPRWKTPRQCCRPRLGDNRVRRGERNVLKVPQQGSFQQITKLSENSPEGGDTPRGIIFNNVQ